MGRTVLERLQGGVVIPAHPLAVNASGSIDERAQRALSRYYLACGVNGLAVGVHTTQFELHGDRGRLADVWRMAAEETANAGSGPLLVAGLCGDTADAVVEAELASSLGYEAVLLCPYGMTERTEKTLLERAEAVGAVLPTIGFYLQESVGGLRLSPDYWRRLFDQPSTVAVKTAPFDRYRTNDVVQTLLEHDRWNDISLLTGNDDAIVQDLITPYRRTTTGGPREIRAGGGLLGQWAVGTRAAVQLVKQVVQQTKAGAISDDLLALSADLVDVNAAVFDVDNNFSGCVAGVNEVLRQQGLLATSACLGDREVLSAGQREKIAAARERHQWLLDEEFISTNIHDWLT
ncbi:dihydrodipicolinate synthase family protein [Arthrobacter sp. 4R501]|uniref:dihydrodipicolinate synthase family protein n=1 Tax=Arthrobacter sp. 4R501 TaxID=2058886 RepID=UPI000CE30254|nr:dihydrodipicolinate synthase family protein [Arthrobacter sp. 4R501]